MVVVATAGRPRGPIDFRFRTAEGMISTRIVGTAAGAGRRIGIVGG